VYVFFVVSGFSLSTGICSRAELGPPGEARRGTVLALCPADLPVCLLTDLLMRVSIVPPAPERPPPWSSVVNFEPSFVHVVRYSFYEVYAYADSGFNKNI